MNLGGTTVDVSGCHAVKCETEILDRHYRFAAFSDALATQ